MKSIKVTLAGKPYTIKELPRKRNAAWRERFQSEFVEVATALSDAAGTDITSATNIAEMVRMLMGRINDAVERLLPLLAEYAPELAADIEKAQEDIFESEVIDAFLEVLALAYPFGRAVQTLRSISSGLGG